MNSTAKRNVRISGDALRQQGKLSLTTKSVVNMFLCLYISLTQYDGKSSSVVQNLGHHSARMKTLSASRFRRGSVDCSQTRCLLDKCLALSHLLDAQRLRSSLEKGRFLGWFGYSTFQVMIG